MKIASIAWGFLLSGAMFYVACASGSSAFDSSLGGGTNTTTTITGVGGLGGSGGYYECSLPCASNIDCEANCDPAPVGSSACCDTLAQHCYLSNTQVCPNNPPPQGGSGGSMY